ncbi:uncharacterized protein LOC130591803 [Beta vulgaris subsp. vulgaris]|uniref:uncharacterized protein LOC130591803 n=1 Tax=Beta vulgaris subsp. vulgaris TaxID=3555 RepID=UPI0025487E37|nr:uncharacterized protein LOC130591803 [Beta vulgaris subsp. vulgaris]
MADYEKYRQMRIAENRLKLQEMGVKSMAYEISQSMKGKKRICNNKKKYQKPDHDDEYIPGEDCEQLLIHSSEDSDNDKREKCITLRSQSKKILAQKISPAMLKDNASDCQIGMASLVKRGGNTRKIYNTK